MRIQPIITTGTTDKGNTYVKSNAGKYFAAGELSAIATTAGFVRLAKLSAASKTPEAVEQTAEKLTEQADKAAKKSGITSFLHTAKENIVDFFKHPIKTIKKPFGGEITKDSIKKAGGKLLQKAKDLSPAKKAVILSSAVIVATNLAVDFISNKVRAHKADKNAY